RVSADVPTAPPLIGAADAVEIVKPMAAVARTANRVFRICRLLSCGVDAAGERPTLDVVQLTDPCRSATHLCGDGSNVTSGTAAIHRSSMLGDEVRERGVPYSATSFLPEETGRHRPPD